MVGATAEAPHFLSVDEFAPEAELSKHAGIVDANILFDRQLLEQEAREKIASRQLIAQPEVERQEYQDNSRTALMEALTASGHLSRVVLEGSLEEIESQMLGRLLNGYDDSLPVHEKKRRFAEIVNVLYGQKVRAGIVAGEVPENTAIIEMSDYPEPLTGTNLGYRDANKKGMVRSSHLVAKGDGQYELVIEQVSRSNATGDSTLAFLSACDADRVNCDKPRDLVGLETPLIYSRYDYADGVVDVMRKLDRHQGEGALYGDTGEAKVKHVSYAELRDESMRREQEVSCYFDDLAALEEQLDDYVRKGQMTRQERTNNLNGEIVRILMAICTLEPEYAEATFGKGSVYTFRQAAVMAAKGDIAEAESHIRHNQHLMEKVTFCGAVISVAEAQKLGLKVSGFGERLKEGKESWTWKRGVCAVKTCRTRPGKTEVGPCSVCRKCQDKFDSGDDPTRTQQRPKKKRTRGLPLQIEKPRTHNAEFQKNSRSKAREIGSLAAKSRLRRRP